MPATDLGDYAVLPDADSKASTVDLGDYAAIPTEESKPASNLGDYAVLPDVIPTKETGTPASDKALSETSLFAGMAPVSRQQQIEGSTEPTGIQKGGTEEIQKVVTAAGKFITEQIPRSPQAFMRAANIPTDWTSPVQLAEFAAPAIKPMMDLAEGAQARTSQIYQAWKNTPPGSQERYDALVGAGLDAAQIAAMLFTGGEVSKLGKAGEVADASKIPSPESVPQPEIRPPVGEEAPLRQQGETSGTQEPVVAEPSQETPQLVRQTPTGPELAQPEAVPAAVSVPESAPAAEPTEVPVRGTQADVAQARETAGLDPYERDLQRSWGDAAEVSRKKVTRYAGYEERLAQEIDKKPRPVTDDEHVSLLRNWQRAEVEHQMAVDAVNQAPDPITKNMAQDALATAKDKLEQAVGAIDKSGSAAGRGFNIRKMILKEFYTPERMESRVRAAKGGKALTEDEVKQVNDYSDQMRKARVESAKAESQRAADARYADRANGSVGKKVNGVKSIKDVHDVLASEAEAARRRILAKRGSMEWKDKVDPCVL